MGLLVAERARITTGNARLMWIVLGAFSIGAAAIWAMHFIAMMGFSVSGTPIRYDVGLTIVSGALAVVVVGVGLFIAIIWRHLGGLLLGGAITGTGAVIMHYIGMASIRMDAQMSHEPLYIAAAVAIALVAATAALWFALHVRGGLAMTGASLLMAAAVCSMHYVGMMGVQVDMDSTTGELPSGATATDFFLPLLVGLTLLLMVIGLILMLSPNEKEMREDEELRQRISRKSATGAARPGSAFTPVANGHDRDATGSHRHAPDHSARP
ncbi:MAG: histidine kinase [Nocardiopsaceae bacterium]|nr:histidine kinase [Nocardiopsaceae bacterium]